MWKLHLVLIICIACKLAWSQPITNLKEHLQTNGSIFWRDLLRNAKAAEMLNYMNTKVDPCTDFYEFSCGKWIKYNPANGVSKLTTGFFENLNAAATKKMQDILTGNVSINETKVDKQVKKFYKSCIHFGKENDWDAYREQLLEIIAEFGEMPALVGKKWRSRNFDWITTIAKISRKYGRDILLDISIQPDFLNNTRNRVYFGRSELQLEGKAMYLDNSTENYRTNYKKNIAIDLTIYLDLPMIKAIETAVEIVNFEIALAEGMLDDKKVLSLADITVARTVSELHAKYSPIIDMKKYVNITIGEVNEPIYEFMEGFQENLAKVIEETPKRVLANYIFFRLLTPFFVKYDEEAEKMCIDYTKKYFVKILDNMVYRKYSTKDVEDDVYLIWKELKSSFNEELSSSRLSWITAETRQKAIEKLASTKLEINSYAHEDFNEEFGNLQVSEVDYVENLKHIMQVVREHHLLQLNKPPKPLDVAEIVSYSPVNIVLENKIKIPIAILQPFFLWAEYYPNALKFATLGSLIGHELIHGFDDNGRTYDKLGNDNDWWDKESTISFNNRTQCFVEQYQQYIYGGRHLPKSESQSENIADNGGLRLAYKAYIKWLEQAMQSNTDLKMETMPYLNYTSKQLFFISFAQIWCNDVDKTLLNYQALTDEHVPGKYRVIGTLSNFEQFSKEFKCAVTTKMNPKNKCEIY